MNMSIRNNLIWKQKYSSVWQKNNSCVAGRQSAPGCGQPVCEIKAEIYEEGYDAKQLVRSGDGTCCQKCHKEAITGEKRNSTEILREIIYQLGSKKARLVRGHGRKGRAKCHFRLQMYN